MGDALVRLVQDMTFQHLLSLNFEDLGKASLPAIGRMIADLNRAAVNQKKWQIEIQERAQAAASRVQDLAKKEGLQKQTIDYIVAEITGIAL